MAFKFNRMGGHAKVLQHRTFFKAQLVVERAYDSLRQHDIFDERSSTPAVNLPVLAHIGEAVATLTAISDNIQKAFASENTLPHSTGHPRSLLVVSSYIWK